MRRTICRGAISSRCRWPPVSPPRPVPLGCRVAGHRDQRRREDPRRHLRRRVHSSRERLASRRADLAGRVRATSRDARHRQADCRRRLLGAGAQSLLSRRPRRPVRPTSASFSFQNKDDMTKLQPLMGSDQRGGRGGKRRGRRSSPSSTRSRRSTRRRRSAPRATAWADRWSSGPPRPFPTASAPARRSTAAAWSPTAPTARTRSLPR